MKNSKKFGITWKYEVRKLKDLKPYKDNLRIANFAKMQILKESIKSLGSAQVWNILPDGTVLNGNRRLEIMIEEFGPEYKQGCYVAQEKLSETKMKEICFRLNSNEGGDFDKKKIALLNPKDLARWGSIIKQIKEEIKGDVPFAEELGERQDYIVLAFNNEIDFLQAQSILNLPKVKPLNSKEGYQTIGTGRVIKWTDAVKKIRGSK